MSYSNTSAPHFAFNRTAVATVCRCLHVRQLDQSGSAAREADFEPNRSDLDLLPAYKPGHSPPVLADFMAHHSAVQHSGTKAAA